MENATRSREGGRVPVEHPELLTRLLWSCCAAAIVFVARAPWQGSFWVDESISWWLVSGSLSDAWERAVTFQGQSPLYYSLLWSWSRLFGSSELSLRFPSILCGLLALVLVYRLARKLSFGTEAALIAATLCAGSDGFQRAILSARPYALAIVCAVWSILNALECARRPSGWRAVVLAFSILAAFYAHYLFLLVAVSHLVVLYRANVPSRILTLCGIVVLCGMAPAYPQLASLAGRSQGLAFASWPDASSIVHGSLPVPVVTAVIVGLVLGLIWGGREVGRHSGDPQLWAFLMPYVVLPPLIFFTMSCLTGSSLWVSRYWSWQLVPFALLCAGLLERILRGKGYAIAIPAVAAMVFLRVVTQSWVLEDWRGAALLVRDEREPVLLFSGLIEAERDTGTLSPEAFAYLQTPLRAYGASGSLTVIGVTQPEEALQPLLSRAGMLVAIRSRRAGFRSPERFLELARKAGRTVTEVQSTGLVRVYRFG